MFLFEQVCVLYFILFVKLTCLLYTTPPWVGPFVYAMCPSNPSRIMLYAVERVVACRRAQVRAERRGFSWGQPRERRGASGGKPWPSAKELGKAGVAAGLLRRWVLSLHTMPTMKTLCTLYIVVYNVSSVCTVFTVCNLCSKSTRYILVRIRC